MGMRQEIRRHDLTWGLVMVGTAVLQGAAIAFNPELGLYVFAALCLVGALAIPPAILLGVALVSVVSMRFLVIVGWLPASAAFADIPIVWLALAVALIRTRAPERARPILLGLVALMGSVVVAWAFNPSEVLRPLITFMLLGQPFAVFAVLLLVPPSRRERGNLMRLIWVVIAIQVAVGLYQWQTIGAGDPVTGTLSSPHVLGSFCALAILFLLTSRHSLRFALVGLFAGVMVISDSKQINVAIAPALAVMAFMAARRFRFTSALTVAAVTIPLLLLVPSFTQRWTELGDSRTGKAIAVDALRQEATPTAIVIGHGPAMTVSRSAMLTLDAVVREGSALRALDLEPAPMATATYLRYRSLNPAEAVTSVNDPMSSALGVLGDLGLVGIGVILWLIWSILKAARGAPQQSAVVGAWAMYLALGVIYAWWEEPAFSILLGLLTGLVLTSRSPKRAVGGGEFAHVSPPGSGSR